MPSLTPAPASSTSPSGRLAAPGKPLGGPPPPGCTPVRLRAVAPSAAQLCVTHVLVTQTTDSQEQNHTLFTVTDGHATLNATVPNWWPSGGPVAGMVVTIWGHLDAATGSFRVDRWIDHTHGSGPAPAGPYQQVSAVDVAAGHVPEHRMIWVPAYVFLLDPQQGPAGSDGDIHVQTMNGCPAGGVTTESTPPMRGYVDHPALPGLTSSTDETDPPSNHLADAPPVGIPVMILGATRYDYGFGWWEIHPIRAWRFLTPPEIAELAAQCGSDPIPQLNPDAPVPVPFGVPPCTDGSEFGNPASLFSGCGPQCYVAHTAIGQYEQLAGPCDGIKPVLTPDQERFSGQSTSAGAIPSLAATAGPTAARSMARRRMDAALAPSYGSLCGALAYPRGSNVAFDGCLEAMARLAGGETRSPAQACRVQARHAARAVTLCQTAARSLERRLAGRRFAES